MKIAILEIQRKRGGAVRYFHGTGKGLRILTAWSVDCAKVFNIENGASEKLKQIVSLAKLRGCIVKVRILTPGVSV